MQRPPFSLALGRTPAANAATPGGGLLSSAFLASVGRVHGEGGPGQQKANPSVDSSNVKAPLWGARRPAAGVRPSASEKGARRTTHTPCQRDLFWGSTAQHKHLLMQRHREQSKGAVFGNPNMAPLLCSLMTYRRSRASSSASESIASSRRFAISSAEARAPWRRPQHFLNFLPLPQEQGPLFLLSFFAISSFSVLSERQEESLDAQFESQSSFRSLRAYSMVSAGTNSDGGSRRFREIEDTKSG